MAKSNEQKLEDAVRGAAEAAIDASGGTVRSLVIDFQASGELPYRIVTPDEQYPLVGMATIEPQTDPTAQSETNVSDGLPKGDS